ELDPARMVGAHLTAGGRFQHRIPTRHPSPFRGGAGGGV
ncbi:MAG: hypothetical protein AVDCRST_MAG18-1300, partial [uncultured Thermomicrobiales bacterium]